MLWRPPETLRKAATIGGTIPAPVRGLNVIDGLADMAAGYAVILTNWFPESNYCRIRRGFEDQTTGISGDVTTLMEWAGPSSRKFFAANASAIYDISAAGAVGAASVSSLTNGYWQYVNFTTSGGSFLIAVNGADTARSFDGTTWAEPSITGPSATSALINIASHKKRLWFVEKDTTKAWYLATDAITGAATAFQLGSVFRKGGKLKLIGTMSHDSGAGADDYCCFISSRGEIAVYQGTDPAAANTWSLVGTFLTGAPIGDRALFNVGGDLAMLSEDGVISISQMMQLDRAASDKAAITNKISDLFSDAFQSYGSLTGWQATIYPRGHMALFNVPISSTEAIQYVMNTQTGAWCKFEGMNARCWGLFGEDIYFGGATAVWKADSGTADDGASIAADMACAYSYPGGRGVRKRFTMIRPVFESNGPLTLALRLNVDYRSELPSLDDSFLTSEQEGSLWGTMIWGTGYWGGPTIRSDWYATYGDGYAASPRLRTVTDGVAVKLHAFDIKAERATVDAL